MREDWRRKAGTAVGVFLGGFMLWWGSSWVIGEELLYESMVPDLKKAYVEGTILCADSSVFLSESGAKKFMEILNKHDMGVEIDPGGYCKKIWDDPLAIQEHPHRFWIKTKRRWGVLV